MQEIGHSEAGGEAGNLCDSIKRRETKYMSQEPRKNESSIEAGLEKRDRNHACKTHMDKDRTIVGRIAEVRAG